MSEPRTLFEDDPPALGSAPPPPEAQAPEELPAPASIPPPRGWPEAPTAEAYHGLPGAVVCALAPHSEADPVAILTQLLIAAGSAVGRGAYFQVEATLHHPNEFLLLAGETAKARKGSSFDHVSRLLQRAEGDFHARLRTGLSSGEGLVWALRDANGQDPGAKDKRMLVLEAEFASVLRAAGREISTLSPTLRCAWDGRPLQLLTRTAPARATGAHISLIGHITAAELRRHTTTVELANGFLNRFLVIACRRVRLLPEGGDEDPLKDTGLTGLLAATIKHAQTAGRLRFDEHARELWFAIYERLSAPADGLAGQLTARAEAHTIRLALIYALLDGASSIKPEHLKAALALWDYAARSAAWALEQATGDPLAEQIHAALARNPDGLTRTQLRDLSQRNLPAQRVEQALHALAAAGRAKRTRTLTAGRPAELWSALGAPKPTPAA